MTSESKTFTCDTQGMLGAQAFLESVCDAPKPAVVMDEIVSNIVRCSGAKEFSIGLELAGQGLTMVFADTGRPFDPTRDADEPDVTAPVADRQMGGLGLFMVRKMSKSVSYVRKDGKNVLTVVI